MRRFINCQSGLCRLQWRGKGSLSSWSLALRAGVLRRAVSHTARPVLPCATHRLALAAQLAPPEKIHRLSASVTQIKMVHVSLSFGVAPETQMLTVHFPHKFGFNRSVRCGLTGRSTGHFAAVRVWASKA